MKKSIKLYSKLIATAAIVAMMFALCFCLLPNIANTQNAEAQGAKNDSDVAQIGGTKYSTLQAAFNACQPGDTIKLLKDKITVADYGSTSYGKYTEITASSPTAAEVGTAMPDDALANIVLRRQNAEGVANTLINSYNGNTAPRGYITIEGLHDDTHDGTQIGTLDFSGADYIKLKYLKFDAENNINAYCYYGSKGNLSPTTNKEKADICKLLSISGNDPYTCSICDVNYGGPGLSPFDTDNSGAIGIDISNCTFTGTITEEESESCYYDPITCRDVGMSGTHAENWKIDSCNFQCQCDGVAYVQGFSNSREKDNTFTFTNNICGSSDSEFYYDILSSGTSCTGNINISGNEFINWGTQQKNGGGCIWITYPSTENKCNYTIKNNKFNYTQGEISELTNMATIRLKLNYTPLANSLFMNDVAYDATSEETKQAFYDAFTNSNTGNIHPGWGYYYESKSIEKWMYIADVSFDTDGGSEDPDTQYIINGEKATAPADPTKEGYTFKGWYAEEATTAFDFANTTITKPTKLTAKWEENTCTVTFDTSGGSYIDPQTVKYGKTATKPSPDPTKEGYIFDRWMLWLDAFDFTTPITSNTTLTALWKSNGGEYIQVLPSVPLDAKGNHLVEFDDEAKQEAQYNAEKIVTDAKAGKDAVGLTAEKNAELKTAVDIDPDIETTVTILEPIVTQKIVPTEEEKIIEAASLPSSKTACTYDFKMKIIVKVYNSSTGLFEEKFSSDLTEIEKSVDYKVRLNLEPTVYQDSAIQVLKVHQLVASDITSDCDINRTEYYADVPAYQFSTYLVNYSSSMYLTFDSQGGSEMPRQIVTYNTCATEPASPTRDGYTFEGWFNEPECETAFNFAQPLTLQKTVYAKWKENGGGGGGGGDAPSNWEAIANAGGSASTSDMMTTIIITLVAIAGACVAMMLLKRKFDRK